MTEYKVITAACLCGRNAFVTSIAKSSLPIKAGICHCYGCRHVSGTLGYASIPWPGNAPPTDNLTRYEFSPRVWTYFCGTCGTLMFWHQHQEPVRFQVNVGVIDQPDSTVEISSHFWVTGTRDGGWADFLPVIDNRPLPRWKTRSNDYPKDLSELLPVGWRLEPLESLPYESSVRAHCLCKGVDFFITRPSAIKVPDVPEGDEWWQVSGDRYPAGCCVCSYCRLASGCDVQHWAFVPKVNIKLPDGSDFQPQFGTLKTYRSSHEASRQFCGRCGAVVFYTADGRSGLVDVAAGLLTSASGARAESWLAWRGWRISWESDAIHTRLRDALISGLKDWSQRQPDSSYQNLGKEESVAGFKKLLAATNCNE